jgi:glucose-1-phosphate thymidylyltransferase
LDGWRIDVGYPEDREEAEAQLKDSLEDDETTVEPAESD